MALEQDAPSANTAMCESKSTCTFQQRSHPMINISSDPNAPVPGGNRHSSSFEKAAYIKTNPKKAYGKAQSRGGDANTVLEVVLGFPLYGVSVLFEQCVLMQVGTERWLEKKSNRQEISDTR